MFTHTKINGRYGFTLVELLVVLAIIAILTAMVMISIRDSRIKGRDAARKTQIQEVLKAMELFYTDGNVYPNDGTPANSSTGAPLTNIGSGFIGGRYFKRLPDDHDRYQYCVSANGKSMMLAVNTESDRGGSNYCSITRGFGSGAEGFGCTAWMNTNATSSCATRF